MPHPPRAKVNVDEFLAWSRQRDERWELHQGEVVAMAPESMAHERVKSETHAALRNAILRAGSSCRVHRDGPGVRVDAGNFYRPDVLVSRETPPHAAVEITDPVIVVEVLAPRTAGIDRGPKFVAYFSLPTIAHYLVLDADRRELIHHQRGRGENIETRVIGEGVVRLDPPGLVTAVADMFTRA